VTGGRTPRSRLYDGSIYARLMDPWLAALHRIVAERVTPDSRVLDVGCGTGNLSFLMAPTAEEVVGVELSPAMVAWADQRRRREGFTNVSFILGDAVEAARRFPDRHFDAATMVLALHEMPAEARETLLREIARTAKKILVVDFRVPLPWTFAGLRNRLAELAAGPEHFRAFRDFNRRGGIPGIAESAGLRCRRFPSLPDATLDLCLVTT